MRKEKDYYGIEKERYLNTIIEAVKRIENIWILDQISQFISNITEK